MATVSNAALSSKNTSAVATSLSVFMQMSLNILTREGSSTLVRRETQVKDIKVVGHS